MTAQPTFGLDRFAFDVAELQRLLAAAGFDPGPVDGEMNDRTAAALVAFKRSRGLKPRPVVGPLTWAALTGGKEPRPAADLPWMIEAWAANRRHEVYDNAWLRAWLKSDGAALGDPKVLPWCGDFAETAIKRGLPSEPFTGALAANPYWALNWQKFGRPCELTYGAIWSGPRPGGGGHVAFVVGADASRVYLLGGNQSNKSTVSPFARSRIAAGVTRWPLTHPLGPTHLPWMTSAEATSRNEA